MQHRGFLLNCARFDRLLEMRAKTPEVSALVASSEVLVERVSELTGASNLTLFDLGVVADTWRIEQASERRSSTGQLNVLELQPLSNRRL